MSDDSALWTWFVFYSGLSTQRAKELLENWHTQSIALVDALGQPQARAASLGITPGEAALLASGRVASASGLPSVEALTWLDDLYPTGLNRLPLKLRPALLFYRGAASLLSRSVVYLAPSAVAADTEERLIETLALLMGEHVLIAAFEGSDQARLAMREMAAAEGELLLFAQSGLRRRSSTDLEAHLVEDGRMVVVSPLSPETAHQPSLDPILQQVAWYAADRVLLTGDDVARGLPADWLGSKPILELADFDESSRPPTPWAVTAEPTDVLDWIEGLLAVPGSGTLAVAGPGAQRLRHPSQPEVQETYEPGEGVSLPPISSEEILATLSKGGVVPEALLRRLRKGTESG
ncbi:MAG: hypothetical protein MUF84_12740 [Anaerolineae bacterium]|nr:hypothetical protein [Anaerolineae bacterium]